MFLEEVIIQTFEKYPSHPLENFIFIVPNKRAVVFLKKYFSSYYKKPCIPPTFLSMSDFVEGISGFKMMPSLHLIFELYSSYKKVAGDKAKDFDTYMSWAQTLISDFNEIDQYLVPTNKIFPYIKAIKEIEDWGLSHHWSEEKDLTPMQSEYLDFWNSLGDYYSEFLKKMTESKQGYRGFIYRHTIENQLTNYAQSSTNKIHIFAGFNALTKAEEKIITEILSENPLSLIFWDINEKYLKNSQHSAGFYIRDYLNWSYYTLKNSPKLIISQENKQEPIIDIIGVSKNVNQAHLISSKISQIPNDELKNTGIILADEKLLIPVIDSINTSNPINITMGYPINQTTAHNLFYSFFKIHSHPSKSWYHKDVVSVLSQPILRNIFSEKYLSLQLSLIKEFNWTYISKDQLLKDYELTNNKHTKSFSNRVKESDKILINILFPESPSVDTLIQNCFSLIDIIKNANSKEGLPDDKTTNSLLILEYLYHFHTLFSQLKNLQQKYSYIHSNSSLLTIYNHLISSQIMDFKGEPLEGIQLMGMLESQNLNFENIIISSVNEGTLPSGKTSNSFIPYDVKKELGLPTSKQRDAIFTYHFYRLIETAKKVTLIYNTEDSDLNSTSEKSRFILQLLSEKQKNINSHLYQNIQSIVASPSIKPSQNYPLCISKTPQIINKIKDYAANIGFSPTALTNYIRNPIDFYNKVVLGVKEDIQVEESIDLRTFGNVIHRTLEELYTPLLGKILHVSDIDNMNSQYKKLILKYIEQEYHNDNITGKNTIIKSVLELYVDKFLKLEKENIESFKDIVVLNLEKKLSLEIKVNQNPIKLIGTADRIEKRGDDLYIIDYKTGNVSKSNVNLSSKNEDLLISDYKYSKAFQLLFYGYIISENKNDFPPFNSIYVGNYSFRNLDDKLLYFSYDKNKTNFIDKKSFFEEKLISLISEIISPDIPFKEKLVK